METAKVSGLFDKWVTQNLLVVLPLVCGLFAFVLGAGVENQMEILPDKGTREAVSCEAEYVDEVPVINEVTVRAQPLSHPLE